jgi:hypothetical protein
MRVSVIGFITVCAMLAATATALAYPFADQGGGLEPPRADGPRGWPGGDFFPNHDPSYVIVALTQNAYLDGQAFPNGFYMKQPAFNCTGTRIVVSARNRVAGVFNAYELWAMDYNPVTQTIANFRQLTHNASETTGDIFANQQASFSRTDPDLLLFLEVHAASANHVLSYDFGTLTFSTVYDPAFEPGGGIPTNDATNPTFLGRDDTKIVVGSGYGSGTDRIVVFGGTYPSTTISPMNQNLDPSSNYEGDRVTYYSTQAVHSQGSVYSQESSGTWAFNAGGFGDPATRTVPGYWACYSGKSDDRILSLRSDLGWGATALTLHGADGLLTSNLLGNGGTNFMYVYANHNWQGPNGEILFRAEEFSHAGYGNNMFIAMTHPSEVWVDDGWTGPDNCGGHAWGYDAFASIQPAINAVVAPGGMVNVAAGVYDEQVVIAQGLTLQGAGAGTIIRPSGPGKLTSFHRYAGGHWAGQDVAGVVLASGLAPATVTVRDLQIDGVNLNALPTNAEMLAGIVFGETGGLISNVTVIKVGYANRELRTYGIDLSAYVSPAVSVEVAGCHITDYTRHGVMADGGTSIYPMVNIHDNVVTGPGTIGPTQVPSGIVLHAGVGGAVRGNTVSHCHYSDAATSWRSVGIMMYDVCAPGVVIENNNVSDVDDGLNLTNNVTAQYNTLTGNGNGVVLEYDTAHDELITHNVIHNNVNGIQVNGAQNPNHEGIDPPGANNVAIYNSISGNSGYGVLNYDHARSTFLAENNWWGAASGPHNPASNPSGTGDDVSDFVDFDPWTTADPGNVVFVPDPQYFTTGQAKTLTVRYLGGASGPLFSWKIRVYGWTGSIVDATAADVSAGTLFSSFFLKQDTGGDEITITGSLVGNDPGTTGPCDLFTVTFHAASQGECHPQFDVQYFRDRNFNNLTGIVPDAGDLIVDATTPAVSPVALTNVTLTGITNDYCKNGDVLGLTATVTDAGDPFFGTANITADLSQLVPASAPVHPTSWNVGTHVATWANFTVTNAAAVETGKTVTVTATDGAGNIASGSDAIILDNIKPTAVTAASAAPGHKKVTLAWTNGSDGYPDGVEIRYNVWQGSPYWLYQFTADPGYPPNQTAGTALWTGTGIGFEHSFANYDRGIYEYTIVARDMARNYSVPVAGSKARATNYWLGDVAPYTYPSTPAYDGYVGTADISALGNTYYSTSNMECDVARFGNPNNPRGIPAPDGAVDFEDLMIFALNFGVVAPTTVPPFAVPSVSSGGAVALSIQLPDVMSPGSEFEARVMLTDETGATQGARFVVAYDPNVLEYLGSQPGSLVQGIQNSFFMPVMVEGQPDISAAALGEGLTFGHSGELAKLRFRCAREGTISLALQDVVARNARNEDLLAGSSDVVEIPVEVKLPAEVFLRTAQPNPFVGTTTMSYGLPKAAAVKLAVYDVSGRLVRVLADGMQTAGEHPMMWDGRDGVGNRVSSGLYLYRLETKAKTITRKVIVTE